jgi:plasmid maintenance system killer protein
LIVWSSRRLASGAATRLLFTVSMTANDHWRICFEFRKGDAHRVEIVDHHGG